MKVAEMNNTLLDHTEWLIETFGKCVEELTVGEDHDARMLSAAQAVGLAKAIVSNMEAQIAAIQHVQGILQRREQDSPSPEEPMLEDDPE